RVAIHRSNFGANEHRVTVVRGQESELFNRISTLARWAVSPSTPAKRMTSGAIDWRACVEYWTTLLDLRKWFADRPDAQRAVPPVGERARGRPRSRRERRGYSCRRTSHRHCEFSAAVAQDCRERCADARERA